MMLPMQFCCNLTRILFTNCVAKILKVPELRNLPLYPTNVRYCTHWRLRCFGTVSQQYTYFFGKLLIFCNRFAIVSTVLLQFCTVR